MQLKFDKMFDWPIDSPETEQDFSFEEEKTVLPTKKQLKILFPLEIYTKMLAYAQASNGEISGFGKTKLSKDNSKIKILDIRIFRQKVTQAHTELAADSLHDFYYSLIQQNEDPSRWNLWWHSHNDFEVFFSEIDINTISSLSKDTTLLSICINKAGELTGRLDVNGESSYNEEDIEFVLIPPKDLMSKIKNEVKQKVKYV